ncbi:MAG TPA: thioesterase [Cytophagales bacterium]|nr:thioesterase [Cytophagales bacterium]
MTNPNFYTHPITVSAGDIDVMGHVNNVVYLRYVQEAATAHWQALADVKLQTAVLWVVLRHEIDYLAPAFAGETLQAKTWVGETGGVKSVRFVEITNASGKILAKARTVWCMLDAHTLKPKRIESGIMEPFM